jgi:hypothetical protein
MREIASCGIDAGGGAPQPASSAPATPIVIAERLKSKFFIS